MDPCDSVWIRRLPQHLFASCHVDKPLDKVEESYYSSDFAITALCQNVKSSLMSHAVETMTKFHWQSSTKITKVTSTCDKLCVYNCWLQEFWCSVKLVARGKFVVSKMMIAWRASCTRCERKTRQKHNSGKSTLITFFSAKIVSHLISIAPVSKSLAFWGSFHDEPLPSSRLNVFPPFSLSSLSSFNVVLSSPWRVCIIVCPLTNDAKDFVNC